MKKTLITCAAALALVFAMALVAGCGGGNGNSGNDGPDPTPAPTPTPTPSTDPTPGTDPTPSTDPESSGDPNAALREMFMGLKESERAEILVKGTLQAAYMGKADQEYRVLYYVEDEAIVNSFENTKGQVAAYVMQYFGIDSSLLSQEVMGQMCDMVGELLKFRRINIGPSGWNGADKYDVMVTVYPIDTLGLVGSLEIMEAWDAKEEVAKTQGAAAAEDSYAKAIIALLEKVRPRTDTVDEGVTVLVPVKVGDKEAGTMWITDTAPLDEIDRVIIKWEYPDAS